MSKEKQIEEMAVIVSNSIKQWANELPPISNPHFVANAIYNAGYRKQSEGEWIERDCITESKRGRTIHYSTQKCSVCGKWNGRHKTNFCPNCGAKMKGGAE